MKRIIAILLALTMMVLICGCGKKSAKPSKKTPNVSEEVVSEEQKGDYIEKISVEGTPVAEDAVYDLDFNTANIETVEYKTHGSTLDTKWDASGVALKGNTDAEANELRNKILNAKNTADIYKITGTKYYISPNGDDANDGLTPETAFKTVNSKAFSSLVKPGDAVLFERGGVWRLSSSIKAREGVTYGSYGEGEKPAFYMSPYNYARSEFWLPSKRENVWKVSAADIDIGLLVFNEGEIVGIKQTSGIISLEKNGDYYYNKDQDTLYVYCDAGNPGKVYTDIEIGFRKSIISISRAKNVTIDNLKLKYTGTFGISLSNSDGSTITNCEIGFIGGAYQNVTEMLRYGNGIQQWNSVYDQTIENNWIYQVYDAGLTWQGDYSYTINNDPDRIDQYKNISYCNNLFEYCSFSVEFWHAVKSSEDAARMICTAPIENFVLSNNISRFAGYGWGAQRPDHSGHHILVYNRAFKNAKDCKITNNLFDYSNSYITRWNFVSVSDNGDWDISNNTFYQRPAKFSEGIWFGGKYDATSQSTLETCISKFDKSPKLVKWINK